MPRYFGHPQRINTNVWPKRVHDYVVPGILWDAITNDLKDLNIRKEIADEQVER